MRNWLCTPRVLLTGVLGIASLGSTFVLLRALSAEPVYDRRPRLATVVDGGKMEEFLGTAAEKAAILGWVDEGTAKSGWPEVSAIFEKRCVRCHYTDAVYFEMLPLDRYEPAAYAAEVRPVLEEKINGGTMGEYLKTAEEQKALLDWVQRGAPESGWPQAKAILELHCVHCHNPEGVPGLPSLDTYSPAARLSRPADPRPQPAWMYAGPAGVFLVSIVGVLGMWRKP